ncbi:MAG: acyltransferase [Acetobacteraceae bacterium]|nr:acyltransferase [Acetobacteraceae bacterium]
MWWLIMEITPLTSLRGFAALWVVFHHLYPAWFGEGEGLTARILASGYAAVDLFFILSGYILATVYWQLRAPGLPGFLLRRICRVYPLHVSIMATLAVAALTKSQLGAPGSYQWAAFPSVLLLLQAYTGARQAWNPPSWSIGVELLCYCSFLPIIMLTRRTSGYGVIVLLLGAAGAAEYTALAAYGDTIVGTGAVLRGVTGFVLGVLLRGLDQHASHLPSAWASVGQLGALGGLLYAAASQQTGLAGASSALLIFCLAGETGIVARAFSARWCVWLGEVSFSIYLLHSPLIFVFERVQARVAGIPPLARAALFVFVLLMLADLTYRWIEQPGRRIPALLTRARWLGAESAESLQSSQRLAVLTASGRSKA